MKVKTLRPVWVDGKSVDKGKTIDVDDALGRQMIGANQAEPAANKSQAKSTEE